MHKILVSMSFIDLFKSRESREKLSHLKNLVAVAFADGKLEDNEMAALATVMARDGLMPSNLERCIKKLHRWQGLTKGQKINEYKNDNY